MVNEKRNRKGKEYKNSIESFSWDDLRETLIEHYLEFEGEYINGKRNGNGKEYDKNGEIVYEGEKEYLNGKKNGKVKSYKMGDSLCFEGEFLNGEEWNRYYRNSDGKMTLKYINGCKCK